MHILRFEKQEGEFEDLDTYHRLQVYRHLGKMVLSVSKIFGIFDNLLSVKNIYKQILYHKSYMRYRQHLLSLVNAIKGEDMPTQAKDDKQILIQFANILSLIE